MEDSGCGPCFPDSFRQNLRFSGVTTLMGLWGMVTDLWFLACTVPTLAAQSESAGVNPLTPQEQAWLNAHPDITLGFTDAFEPAVIINPDGSYRGTLVDLLDLLNLRGGTDFKVTVEPIPDLVGQVNRKALEGVLSISPR